MNDRTSAEHCYIGLTFLLYLFILLLSIIPRYSPNTPRDYLGIIEIIQGLLSLSRDYPDLFYVFKVCSHVCMHLASGSTLPNVVRARWLVPFDLT